VSVDKKYFAEEIFFAKYKQIICHRGGYDDASSRRLNVNDPDLKLYPINS